MSSSPANSPENKIEYKKIDSMLIAYIQADVQNRAGLIPVFEKLEQHCQEYICGPRLVNFLGSGAQPGTYRMEAARPVTQIVETDEIKSKILEKARVLTLYHYGERKMRETFNALRAYATGQGWAINTVREVWVETHPDNPEKDITEVQALLDAKCRITVLKRMFCQDLVDGRRGAPTEACTRFTDGQEFVVNSITEMPEGFGCSWAWNDIYKTFIAVYRDAWFSEGAAIACCTDGDRPVFFRIEKIEE